MGTRLKGWRRCYGLNTRIPLFEWSYKLWAIHQHQHRPSHQVLAEGTCISCMSNNWQRSLTQMLTNPFRTAFNVTLRCRQIWPLYCQLVNVCWRWGGTPGGKSAVCNLWRDVRHIGVLSATLRGMNSAIFSPRGHDRVLLSSTPWGGREGG